MVALINQRVSSFTHVNSFIFIGNYYILSLFMRPKVFLLLNFNFNIPKCVYYS